MSDMPDTTEHQTLQLTLHPSGVIAPAQNAAFMAAQIVCKCLHLFSVDDLAVRDVQGLSMGFNFNGPEMNVEDKRRHYRNWVLSKGFQDLARGVRSSLEEAYFYITVLKWVPETITFGQLQERLDEVRNRANRTNFPDLLSFVNSELATPMTFAEEFLSIQKVRNCLEHRDGIVSDKDIDEVTGNLKLMVPCIRLVIRADDGTEHLFAPGTIIDTHAYPAGAEVLLRRSTYEKVYTLGEKISFTSQEFTEIAMSCYLFAQDLGGKLPQLPVRTATSGSPQS